MKASLAPIALVTPNTC
ncbi:hypothetical protein E2C01_098463 [Portunus trituberculatus]|uniref:Uncharacterized protein n=1 Tax=Portunus trituberculatus TaxID=210409 RepID=A0A5B7K8G1_PORTR|nr:hypothetical protein [Portunus trituberculatus]